MATSRHVVTCWRRRELLATIAADLAEASNRQALNAISEDLEAAGLTPQPTPLRLLDIAVWMDAHQ